MDSRKDKMRSDRLLKSSLIPNSEDVAWLLSRQPFCDKIWCSDCNVPRVSGGKTPRALIKDKQRWAACKEPRCVTCMQLFYLINVVQLNLGIDNDSYTVAYFEELLIMQMHRYIITPMHAKQGAGLSHWFLSVFPSVCPSYQFMIEEQLI